MRKKLVLLLMAATVISWGCSKKVQDHFVLVEGGTAIAVSTGTNQEVPVIEDFYIGKFEVTQEEWTEVMGSNPSAFKGSDLPVDSVSWYDSIEYCNRRSEKEGLTPYYKINKQNPDPDNICDYDDIRWIITINEGANGYRLPTEAEWIYAASGGSESQQFIYSGSSDEEETVWYWRNAGKEYLNGDWYWPDIESNQNQTHSVGSKKPMNWGSTTCREMSGNGVLSGMRMPLYQKDFTGFGKAEAGLAILPAARYPTAVNSSQTAGGRIWESVYAETDNLK